MRKIYKQLLIALLTMMPVGAWAQTTFTQGDFTYTVTDEENHKVSIAKANEATLEGALVVPSSVTYEEVTYAVTSITMEGFYNANITSVTFPSSVTTIGASAFLQSGLTGTLTIPSTVTNIGDRAFSETGLTGIVIEDSATPLTIRGDGSVSPFNSLSDTKTLYLGRNLTYSDNNNGAPFGGLSSVEIGPQVTTIHPNMFREAEYLARVIIGSGVTTIGASAFQYCGTFWDEYNKVGVEEMVVTMGNNVTSIGESAFWGCNRMRSITLPSGLTTIGVYAFLQSGLTGTLTIPASVTSIGERAFSETGLTGIVIEDSATPLTIRGDGSVSPFNYLSDTKTLYLGRNLTYSDDTYGQAFGALSSVEFGPQVTAIPDYLFVGFEMSSVKAPWLTPISFNAETFSDETYSNATLWIPGGTMAAYQAADGWKNFTNMDYFSFVVSITGSAHGTLAVADISSTNGETKITRINRGTDAVFTVTPATGYELTTFTVNSVAKTPTEGQFTVSNLQADQTVVAGFTPITYTLTYTLYDGTATNPATYNIETETFTLANPMKKGYDFTGWKLNGEGEAMMEVIIAKGSTGNKSYTATWKPTIYNIEYTLDGGTVATANPATYTIETETFTLNNPTKTGYTFKGWKLNGEGEAMMEVSIVKGSTGHKAYTATWQINQYTISFNSNGGTEVDPITQDYNTAVTAPAAPTRTGYTFKGWTPAVPETIPAEDITCTATWQINQYTITFDSNGGSDVDPIKQDYNTAVTAPAAPTKTGYTFTGWTPAVPETIPAEDMTVTAQWQINQYTITFDSNGGSDVDPITQDYNTAVTAPAAPTKKGYSFEGWTPAVPTTMPAENKTLTATWNLVTYNITYNLAGGTVATANPTSYNVESAAITLNNPTKEHFDFAGWTGTGLDAATKTVVIATGSTEDRSYTATWTKQKFTVNITGGNVIADNLNPEYGDDVVLTILEDEDAELLKLTVDGTDVTASVSAGKYTITNVTANVEVVAIWNKTKEGIYMAHSQATFSCTQDLDFTTVEGLKVYVASGYNKSSGMVLMTQIEGKVPAGTGLFLEGEEGETYKVPYTTSCDAYYVSLLKPVVTAQVIPTTEGAYTNFLYGEKEGVKGFYKSSGSGTVAAGKAYLQLPSSAVAGIKGVGFEFDDETAISSVKADVVAPEGVYDIKGRKIPAGQKLTRGIYVINGKKVSIK